MIRDGRSRGREISDRPGTVALRAQAGGFAAPDGYRADHGTRLSPCTRARHEPYVYKRGASNFDTLDSAASRTLAACTRTGGQPDDRSTASRSRDARRSTRCPTTMTAKILIVTGDAAESLEVLYPYQRLLEEGYEVHIAAPDRKKLRFVVHDFEPGYDTYTEKPGYTWPADLAFSEVDPGGVRRRGRSPAAAPPSTSATTPNCARSSRPSSTPTSRSPRSATARCSPPPSTA